MLHRPVTDRKNQAEFTNSATLTEHEQQNKAVNWSGRFSSTRDRPNIATIQQAYGNQAALRMLQSRKSPVVNPVQGGLLQRKCACGNAKSAAGTCAECQEKQEMMLQRKAAGSEAVGEVPAIVHEVLRSPGQPLDRETRTFMESRFGHDFDSVQIHTDTRAAESAKAVNALAYTVGQKVVFGSGQYNPRTNAGKQLLGHELFHTLQQKAITQPTGSGLTIEQPSKLYEQQADEAAKAVIYGSSLLPTAKLTNSVVVQRQVASMFTTNWQYEADRLTVEQLSTEITRMRREISTSGSSDQETLERLEVFERVLLQRDAPIREYHRTRRRHREGLYTAAVDDVFLSGFAAGSLQEIPPGEVHDFFMEDLGRHPTEFMDGCSEGVGRGFADGATGLVESIESTALAGGRLALYAIQHQAEMDQALEDVGHEIAYQVLNERLYTSFVRDRSYLERRERYATELRQIVSVIQRFAAEIAGDPTIVIQWSGDLGLALGQSFGRSVTDDFLRASPREQGVIIGRIIGQILFEVILDLILAVTTEGVGTLIHAAQGIRASARVLRLVQEMAEASPFVRRLISFGEEVVDETTDLTRTVERVREVIPASGDEIAEASRRRILDSAPDLEQPTPLHPESPTIEPEVTGRPERRVATAEGVGERFTYEESPETPMPPVERGRVSGRPDASGSPDVSSGDELIEDIAGDLDSLIDEDILDESRTDELSQWESEVESISHGGEETIDRHHWIVSEQDLLSLAAERFPEYPSGGWRQQARFAEGEAISGRFPRGDPTRPNRPSYTQPDLFHPGDSTRGLPPLSLESKNYRVISREVGDDLELIDEFAVRTGAQALYRESHLPLGTQQWVIVDLRGQQITSQTLQTVMERLSLFSRGRLVPERILFQE